MAVLLGAVALAEFIAETVKLIRLDLRGNYIRTGGLMALMLSLKVNQSVTRIDLDGEPKKEAVSNIIIIKPCFLYSFMYKISDIRLLSDTAPLWSGSSFGAFVYIGNDVERLKNTITVKISVVFFGFQVIQEVRRLYSIKFWFPQK